VHTIGILSVVFIGFEIATSVWGVIVAVAPIVAIDSWLKTQKMGRRIKKLEDRAHESFSNDSDDGRN